MNENQYPNQPRYSAQPAKRNYSRMTKKKQQRRLLLAASAVLLVLIIVGVLLAFKGCSGVNVPKELTGTWSFDQNTKYEFNDNGKGCMCIQDATHYPFTFTVKDNTIAIDYEQAEVNDCEYTYTVDGDKLTLVGGKGTALLGKSYELKRTEK